MYLLSKDRKWTQSQKRWKISRDLFLWMYFLLFGLVLGLLVEILSWSRYERYDWQLEWGIGGTMAFIFGMLMALVPIVYALSTIFRMQDEIRRAKRQKLYDSFTQM